MGRPQVRGAGVRGRSPVKPAPPLRAGFHFHGELNYFLRETLRDREFDYAFDGTPSVKDAIEANRIPHTEVGYILANGVPVDFSYHLRHGDRIAVFPEKSALTGTCPVRLRPPPDPVFIADVHLGTLSRYLRLLGFDVTYDSTLDDPEIVRRAVAQRRIILTRDRVLLHAKVIVHGCCLHSDDPLEQLGEVVSRYDLKHSARPLTRCLVCNGTLREVSKERILDRLEPKTKIHYDTFRQCDSCGKVFWRGSHFGKLDKVLRIIPGGETPDVGST